MRQSAARRGYDRRWAAARAYYLREHPLCRYCAELGRTTIATVVDHKIPHKGDLRLFWDRENWQSLCKLCHDTVKQTEERTGRRPGCNVNGQPHDPAHPWNRPAPSR